MLFKKQRKRLRKVGSLLVLGGSAYCAYQMGCHVTKTRLKSSNEKRMTFQWDRFKISATLAMPVNIKRFQTYPCVLILTDVDYPQENSRKIADALAAKGMMSLRYQLPPIDLNDSMRYDIALLALHQLKFKLNINQKRIGLLGIGKACFEAIEISGKQEPLARCLWNADLPEMNAGVKYPLLCVNATEDSIESHKNAKQLVNKSPNANYLLIKDHGHCMVGKGLDDAILHTVAFMKHYLG